jgi:lycopene cyclase domain-containing protein
VTYFGFLALFLLPPIVVLLAILRRSLPRGHLFALGALMLIALLYTSPWDNYLVIRGVWTFDRDKIAVWFIWRVPLEEYVFYLLQVLLTGLFTIWLLHLTPRPPSLRGKGETSATSVGSGTPFPAREGGRGVRSPDA